MTEDVGAAVTAAFHAEWGRVVSVLIGMTGDWDLAEECAQDAFARALRAWPRDGVPRRPGAWLTTVARNRATDRLRRGAVEAAKLKEAAVLATGLGHVEPVCAELDLGGAGGAGGIGRAECGDLADLLAVERDEAAGEAVAGCEGLVEQQPPDRRDPGVRSRWAGLRPVGAGHRNVDAANDALAAGPGQEGDDVPPGGGSGAEPLVEIVLGAFAELPSAVGQPGQESDRHGEALLGPLVGAMAERRHGDGGPQVAQETPAEEPFEQLAVLGIADAVELGNGPALEVGQAPIAGRHHSVTDQQ